MAGFEVTTEEVSPTATILPPFVHWMPDFPFEIQR
jgi:hypothetical protein